MGGALDYFIKSMHWCVYYLQHSMFYITLFDSEISWFYSIDFDLLIDFSCIDLFDWIHSTFCLSTLKLIKKRKHLPIQVTCFFYHDCGKSSLIHVHTEN